MFLFRAPNLYSMHDATPFGENLLCFEIYIYIRVELIMDAFTYSANQTISAQLLAQVNTPTNQF